jgi:hypothetical protein
VMANGGMQFVPADPIMALVFRNPEFVLNLVPIGVQRPRQQGLYHKIEAVPSSRVFAWQNLDGFAVVKALNHTLHSETVPC